MRSPYAVRDETRLSAACLIAILLPNALLWGAIGFQYIGGLHPCEMCYWQRWAHLAAIGVALLAILTRGRPGLSAFITALAGLVILTAGAIGGFHAGVEYHWWQGITRCSTSFGGSGQAMLDAIMAAPVIRCDVAQWSLFGISMAGYNFLISTAGGLAVLWLVSRWRGRA